ncbi:hypothetical protein FNF27_01105 [Cafeteria roenbergensis]|uniref:Uncharacterized protein n=1 Tax=Cafeteria roenbergensis TaxID=33653 RepID=A0A5A8EKX2_CAFRO|nr:hypothetical protein FNF27_01105 [Cafeteria roenbergensis]
MPEALQALADGTANAAELWQALPESEHPSEAAVMDALAIELASEFSPAVMDTVVSSLAAAAALGRRVGLLRMLSAAGEPVARPAVGGTTALHCAAAAGDEAIATFLLAAGCSPGTEARVDTAVLAFRLRGEMDAAARQSLSPPEPEDWTGETGSVGGPALVAEARSPAADHEDSDSERDTTPSSAHGGVGGSDGGSRAHAPAASGDSLSHPDSAGRATDDHEDDNAYADHDDGHLAAGHEEGTAAGDDYDAAAAADRNDDAAAADHEEGAAAGDDHDGTAAADHDGDTAADRDDDTAAADRDDDTAAADHDDDTAAADHDDDAAAADRDDAAAADDHEEGAAAGDDHDDTAAADHDDDAAAADHDDDTAAADHDDDTAAADHDDDAAAAEHDDDDTAADHDDDAAAADHDNDDTAAADHDDDTAAADHDDDTAAADHDDDTAAAADHEGGSATRAVAAADHAKPGDAVVAGDKSGAAACCGRGGAGAWLD